jgi:hypothetical protein
MNNDMELHLQAIGVHLMDVEDTTSSISDESCRGVLNIKEK